VESIKVLGLQSGVGGDQLCPQLARKGPGSRSFSKNSLTLRDRAFFRNFARISGRTDRIFMKL